MIKQDKGYNPTVANQEDVLFFGSIQSYKIWLI